MVSDPDAFRAGADGEVFGSEELTRNTIPIKIPPFLVEDGHNDLEPVVCRLYPEVGRYWTGSSSSIIRG